MSRDEHIDTRLKLTILLFETRCRSGGCLVFDLKLRDLVGEVSYRIFELALSLSRRILHYWRRAAIVFESLVQGHEPSLKFGYANRSDSSRREILDHPQFVLAKSPVIKHPDQPDGAGRAFQRI